MLDLLIGILEGRGVYTNIIIRATNNSALTVLRRFLFRIWIEVWELQNAIGKSHAAICKPASELDILSIIESKAFQVEELVEANVAGSEEGDLADDETRFRSSTRREGRYSDPVPQMKKCLETMRAQTRLVKSRGLVRETLSYRYTRRYAYGKSVCVSIATP